MNYIKHLTGFFEKAGKDRLLNPTHMSLYVALFQFWNCNRFRNPISISRDEVMRISKISSNATYHKCLKALHAQGYIKYEPSYNPFKGSYVYLFNFSDDLKPVSKNAKPARPNFEPVGEQVLTKSGTGIDTGIEQSTEQALVPSINNTNITNNQIITKGLNENQPTSQNEETISNVDSGTEKEMPEETLDEDADGSSPAFADYNAERTETSRQKKLREKKKDILAPEYEERSPASPKIEEVMAYFLENDAPDSEARKFYNYNNSIGWIIGGKSPITDWKSAANNWILKIPNFLHEHRPNRTTQLDTSPGKDYAEPL